MKKNLYNKTMNLYLWITQYLLIKEFKINFTRDHKPQMQKWEIWKCHFQQIKIKIIKMIKIISKIIFNNFKNFLKFIKMTKPNKNSKNKQ